MTAYAELEVATNFSFLRGASHPEEIVETAAALGHSAVAIADRHTLAGVVRAHIAAKVAKIQLIVGTRIELRDGPNLLLFPTDRPAYGRLSHLLTTGKRRAAKGECSLDLAEVCAQGADQMAVVVPPDSPDAAFAEALRALRQAFGERLSLAARHLYGGDDAARIDDLAALVAAHAVPLVATNAVEVHAPARRPLLDVIACIREHCTIQQAGFRLRANAERHLKPAAEMAWLFRRHPQAVARAVEIARACRFNLNELRYEYPIDPVVDGRSPQDELVRLVWIGAAERYPRGVPAKVTVQIEHELALIAQLGYAPYFLTVQDIVRFARSRGILCQGRGSAANSAVCYVLGVTAVDPAHVALLFERFVSAERSEPPDIDVDFEHERREEVIQYVYAKYGRDRAGMTATTITYRTKSALREVGKAMGLTDDAIVALQSLAWDRSLSDIRDADVRGVGLDPRDRTVRLTLTLAEELRGFPRHLSQHTGGMVMTKGRLSEVVPIENAAMADRTVIEWNKDDLDEVGILKVDILALGMLTCIRKAFTLIEQHYGRHFDLASVPQDDPAVYDMLSRADSIGVFQVESRAQMSMLPRLKPRTFYDLVVQVAIVRPGPIQGDMVHPYLRRRTGEETIDYPSAELKEVLEKTYGVPLFQEQAMRIAIVAAGFTPAEADKLRRSMATFRRSGTIHHFREKFLSGMAARGYTPEFAARCFKQIEGFADYGFPESHAASFALLVYVSAWLKRHYPAVFAAALLNCQPMGFYAPAQIVRDARDHGIDIRPVDVNRSSWDCTLEGTSDDMALRLGFREIKGLSEADATALVAGRGAGYSGLAEIRRRAGLHAPVLETLAAADAFGSLGLSRREALWSVKGLDRILPLFAASGIDEPVREPRVALPLMGAGQEVVEDYSNLGLSLKRHPLALLREGLERDGFLDCAAATALAHGCAAAVAGIVVTRQRPGSADVIFMTIEDETGIANVIVWPQVVARCRSAVLGGRMVGARGTIQRQGQVVHFIAREIVDLSSRLHRLMEPNPSAPERNPLALSSRDFQ